MSLHRTTFVFLLSVLLGAGLAQADTSAVALTVEVRHLCGQVKPLITELIDGLPTPVVIPAGCPNAGREQTLLVDCRTGMCAGVVRVDDVVVGTLQERNGSLVVSTNSPRPFLAIAILSRRNVRVDGTLPSPPLSFLLRNARGDVESSAVISAGALWKVTSNEPSCEALSVRFAWLGADRIKVSMTSGGKERPLEGRVGAPMPLTGDKPQPRCRAGWVLETRVLPED